MIKPNITQKKAKSLFIKLFLYFVLIGISLVFLYPILYMLVNSLKSQADLINPTIEWLPSKLYPGNYEKAFLVLDFWNNLGTTLYVVIIPSVLQTICCALAGYAFARHKFPLKNLWLILVLSTFIIPSQVTLIPKYIMFNQYGLIGNPLVVFLPATLGQGIRSAVFILVFMQFFSSYPKSFDEAARLDGAGRIAVFIKIAMPMVVPAVVVSILFSFVWYWNETYEKSLFIGQSFRTLPLMLQSFVNEYSRYFNTAGKNEINKLNESIRMAATILSIAPPMLLYLGLQKYFIEGIETSGITGE